MLTSNDRNVEGDSGKKGSFETSVAASVWTKKCYELTEKNKDSELAEAFALKNIGSVLFDTTLNLTDKEATVRDEIIQNISNGLLSLFEIFDNEAFVLGGSMSSEPFDLIKLIQSDIKKRYKFPSRTFPEVFIASQGEDSGIIGAAALAFDDLNILFKDIIDPLLELNNINIGLGSGDIKYEKHDEIFDNDIEVVINYILKNKNFISNNSTLFIGGNSQSKLDLVQKYNLGINQWMGSDSDFIDKHNIYNNLINPRGTLSRCVTNKNIYVFDYEKIFVVKDSNLKIFQKTIDNIFKND